MKHEDMIRKQIHEAVDESLSHLDARPSLYGAIMAQTQGEQKVKRRISVGVVLALAMLLAMTAIGVAATRFGMLDFNWRQKENAEYVEHILTLDEAYENDYVSITVTDAVFDGVQLSIAMEMQPKPGCGDGVYVYPEMTAMVNGEPLPVDIEGCRGDFYSGLWSPERDQGMFDFAGEYGADYVILGDTEESGFVYEPQTDEVEWTLSLFILRPLYQIEQLEFGLTEEIEYDAYMKLFTDAYKEDTILLTFEGSPVEYVYAVGAPEGMDRIAWQRMPLPDKMISMGAFERVDRVEISFTTENTDVIRITGDQIYDLGEYEAELIGLSVTFGRMDYEIHVRKKDETVKTAGQEAADGELQLDFVVLTQGCQAQPGMEGAHPLGGNDVNPDPVVRFIGSYELYGKPDTVTFVAYYGEDHGERFDMRNRILNGGAPVTAQQEEMAFTIEIK